MLKHPLAREVTLVVAVKLAIVLGAALFVFGPKQRPAIDAASMERRLFNASEPGLQLRRILP